MLNIKTSYEATMKASSLMKQASNIIDMYDNGYSYDVPTKAWEHVTRLERIADGYRKIASVLQRQEELDRQFEALETRLLRRR